nr:MAG TPA: intron associated endonuclease [Bacteriophage sp.]
MEKISGIYCIENLLNNEKYVGKSNNIYKRWQDEKRALRKHYFHNVHMQRVWDKYGEDIFIFYIIEQCSEDILMDREQFWINKLDTYYHGYNQTLGGEGTLGVVFSDERKEKLRQAHLGDKNFNTRPVYCLELNQEFWGAKEAEDLYLDRYKVSRNGINDCCNGRLNFCGRLEDGTKLHWCYLEDKDTFVVPLQPKSLPIYCFELNEVFPSLMDAKKDSRIINFHYAQFHKHISNRELYKTCGKLVDGTKLTWRCATNDEINHYLEEYKIHYMSRKRIS